MNERGSNKKYLGKLAFVLHAHLPYVRKNEKNSLEEDWLFQAILECYLPLLKVLEESSNENPDNSKLTLSLSPTLLSLLQNSKLKEKFPEWIDTRIRFLSHLSGEDKNASNFLLQTIKAQLDYWFECSGNLVEKFKFFNNLGCIDIITCAATHGYLPILRHNPETVYGQIKTGINYHQEIFGCNPLGIWLPECAYYENLDKVLYNCGIRYAVLDGHGILNSTPRPRYGVYAPICSSKGIAFFGRDSESSLPVWSSKDGFPGDPVYREFHKDLGWELSESQLLKEGIKNKRPLGLKFHKITDSSIPLGEKHYYDETAADKKVEEHAEKYLLQRAQQLKKLSISAKFDPILVAPFDAELFGHWWYEGPKFIKYLFKKSLKYSIELVNLKEILAKKPNLQICEPSPSSWGQGGYHNYWLNDKNAWIVPEISKAGSKFIKFSASAAQDKLTQRILRQAARELLLAQSSDWSFILRAGTTTHLAKERIDRHLKRFWLLINSVENDSLEDITLLERIEEEDNVFPNIDIKDWWQR